MLNHFVRFYLKIILVFWISVSTGWSLLDAQNIVCKVLDKELQLPVDNIELIINGKAATPDVSDKINLDVNQNNFTFIVNAPGYKTLDTLIDRSFESPLIIYLEKNDIMLSSHIVYASWASDNTPVTQKTIKKSDLNSSAPFDIPSMLELMPGAVSTSDAGNNIGYSGLRIRGSDQSRINVTIDGVPVNDAESQNVFWVDLPDLIEDVQSIQVQRGVGISAAGPGAFGANINLQTGQLPETALVSANAGFGSFNTQKYGLNLNSGRVMKNFRFKARGSRISSDGFIDRAFSGLWSGSATAQFDKDKLGIKAIFHVGKERTYQAWNGLPFQFYPSRLTFNSSGLKSDGSYYDDETDNYLQAYSRLLSNYRINSKSVLHFTLYHTYGTGYYNQYREDELQDYDQNFASGIFNLVRERWLRNHLVGLNTYFVSQLNHSTIQGGLNVQNYKGEHYGIVSQVFEINDWAPFVYYDNNAGKFEMSAYVKVDRSFKNVDLMVDLQARQLGYSYEALNETLTASQFTKKHTFFNPKIGATFHLNGQKSIIYFFGGIGNKEPNRDDFVSNLQSQLPKPERMYNGEIGYRYHSSKMSYSLGTYIMYYNNQLILNGRINDVGAYTRINVDRSYRTGLEIDFKWKAISWLEISGNTTLSSNKIIDFKEYTDVYDYRSGELEFLPQSVTHHRQTNIAFSPSTISFVRASFKPFLNIGNFMNRLKINYDFKHVGSQYLDNSESQFAKLPDYQKHTIIGEIPFVWKSQSLSLNATIDNIFNKQFVNNGWVYRYQSLGYNPVADDPTTRSENNNVYSSIGLFPQSGLNVFIGIRWQIQ